MAEPFRYLVVEGPIGVGKTSLASKLARDLKSELLLEQPEDNPFPRQFLSQPAPVRAADTAALPAATRPAGPGIPPGRPVSRFAHGRRFHGRQGSVVRAVDPEFKDELALYQQIYAHLTLDAPRPDLVIYLQAPLATLRERIAQRGIDYEQQIRDDYLARLSESYTRFFHHYDDSALLTVNTQSVDLINNEDDYQALLEKINRDIHGGRHYFNQSSFAALAGIDVDKVPACIFPNRSKTRSPSRSSPS